MIIADKNGNWVLFRGDTPIAQATSLEAINAARRLLAPDYAARQAAFEDFNRPLDTLQRRGVLHVFEE